MSLDNFRVEVTTKKVLEILRPFENYEWDLLTQIQ